MGGGGGGLAGMMSQLMQSPAMQQMADSLHREERRGGPQQHPAPDFGSFLQDMMPMVGQVQHLMILQAWTSSIKSRG